MTDTLCGFALALLLVALAAGGLAGRWLLYGHILPGGVLSGLAL